jgi:hypothetical protein
MRKQLSQMWEDTADELASMSRAEFSLACSRAQNHRMHEIICDFVNQNFTQAVSISGHASTICDVYNRFGSGTEFGPIDKVGSWVTPSGCLYPLAA